MMTVVVYSLQRQTQNQIRTHNNHILNFGLIQDKGNYRIEFMEEWSGATWPQD